MKKLLILVSFFIMTNCAREAKQPMNPLYQSVPREIQGWKAEAEDKTYNRETLFDYINGGAEHYLTYQFREVLVRRFVHPEHPDVEIVLDIYDMSISEDAFGLFTSEREDEETGIGQGSEFGGGLLRFWKDKYFVSIVVLGDVPNAKSVMMELARAVAEAIPSTGNKPAMLTLLPREGLIESEIRYFHASNTLNNYYYVANENILNLGPDTDCVLAQYEREGESGFLLLVRYKDESQSQAAYDSFLRNYMPEGRETGFALTENQRWTAANTSQQYLTVVFDAPEKSWAQSLLSSISFGRR